jgi:hypothetical protein
MTDTDAGAAQLCSCKVGTVAATYSLGDVHDELARKWGTEDGPSVRELTATLNKRVLQVAFREAGTLPIDGEVDNIYRVLTDESADGADRTRARNRLQQVGIDVDSVEDAFVSHQTLYRHLVNCLDASYEATEKTPEERVEKWRRRLLALQNRTADITTQGIEQLSSAEAVDIGSFTVTTEVTVSCEDCGRFYTVEEFLDAEQCDCGAASKE